MTMADMLDAARVYSEYAVETLQIPSWAEWSQAAMELKSAANLVFWSTCRWSHVTFRSPCILLFLTVRLIMTWIYQHIIYRGLYQFGLRQLRDGAQIWWAWQSRLSSRELAIEGVVLGLIAVLALVFRHVKQRKYAQRLYIWYDRRARQVGKSYRSFVGRVGETSQWLAMVTPHALYWSATAAATVLCPRFIRYLACDTPLTLVLSTLGPALSSFLTICDSLDADKAATAAKTADKENLRRRTKSNATRKSNTTPFSRTNPSNPLTPRRRRPRRSIGTPRKKASSPTDSLQDDVDYWKRYWTVYGCHQLLVQFIYNVPIVSRVVFRNTWLLSAGKQVELALVVWLYVMPYLVLSADALPVPFLYTKLEPLLSSLHRGLQVVSPATWEAHVVSYVGKACQALSFVRILSVRTTERITEVLQIHGPALVVPLVTLGMPGMFTSFGVVLVQYALPILQQQRKRAKNGRVGVEETNKDDALNTLRYWVLHVTAQLIISMVGILTWFPHFLLLFWMYMSLPSVVTEWFGAFHQECIDWGLIEGEASDSNTTLLQNCFARILEYLPKHQDDETTTNGTADEGLEGEEAHFINDNATVERPVANITSPLSTASRRKQAAITSTTSSIADDDDDDDDDFVFTEEVIPPPRRRHTRHSSTRISQ